MSMRLGVMGGMFDPVHKAHIEAARVAVRMLALDCLHLVPCHIPNHRDAAFSTPEDRLAMLALAIADEHSLQVNPIELKRNAVSYSVETLTSLKSEYTQAKLVFVLGMDAFDQLPQWYRWRELFELCHFFVLARDTATLSDATVQAIGFSGRCVQSAAEMFAFDAGKIWIADHFQMDLSSSLVRDAIKKKQNLAGQLDDRVIEYIKQRKLYS